MHGHLPLHSGLYDQREIESGVGVDNPRWVGGGVSQTCVARLILDRIFHREVGVVENLRLARARVVQEAAAVVEERRE